ncbi:MAG: serine/threonine protein kinase, partial [Nannocystaceae bacterium]|nr:serine/threonine protein kinase [Nannocystaceae bacterium]
MPREDDIETVIPGGGTSPSPAAPGSPSASVSGVDATAPGRVEYTMPGHDEGPALEPRRTTPEAGDLIGTFVVEELLGRGAMGVVMLARDTDLDRRVAIKLLAADELDPTASARLLREAQSAGSLAHPNVVAVYQVGTHKGQVYVVMEFVDGGTLHEWIREQPRSWEEIVDVYLQAGAGLAAAHRLGLVHRDFKPDNVLLDRHGVARVADFGLARHFEHAPTSPDLERTISSDTILSEEALTATGALVGTPAYLAPELF